MTQRLKAGLTDKELEGLGAQAFNMAKRDIEQRKFNFLLAAYRAGEGLHRLMNIEAFIIERLGDGWLNSGRAKAVGFRAIREAVELLPPEAIVFASIINNFTVTEKFERELTYERQAQLIKGSNDSHHQAVRDGYLKVCDALMAVVQTPERVCMYRQDLDPIGKPNAAFFLQDELDGLLKMFGKKRKA